MRPLHLLAGAIATLLMVVPSATQGQTVRVAVDRRAEVIGILFRIAGAPDFGNGAVQPYIRQVDSAFASFENHAVFEEINRLRAQSGLSLSAVLSMAPQITDPVSFGERAPIDAPSSTLSGRWRGGEARTFLAHARDFAREARLDRFLRDQGATYDSASVRMRRLVQEARLEWLSGFFGEPTGDVFIVAPLLINATGNFAAEFRSGATHERYAYLGVPVADSGGFPVISPDKLPTIIHEFNHSFVDHVVGSRSAELQPSGERIYAVTRRSMRDLAYNSWQVMLNESLVRATVIRYLLANHGPAAAERDTRLQRGKGFVWMGELVSLLGEYETQRRRYPTFAEFMPLIVDYYRGLAPRVDRLVAEFEQERPRIVRASIRDGATDISPNLDTLVLHFDRPVDAIVDLVGDHGAATPELTAATFDATHTILTLGIRLEPGREYVLPLGSGAFVGRDGYPLSSFVLRFRTVDALQPRLPRR
jgi:Domain of unknown function (DUF4932)